MLGRLYTIRPKQYFELGLLAWPVLGVIYLLLHLRRRRHGHKEPKHEEGTGWLELLKRFLEIASGVSMVLGSIVFANAVNLRATGLNSFAVLYENETRQLGSDSAAIVKLEEQISTLKDVSDEASQRGTGSQCYAVPQID